MFAARVLHALVLTWTWIAALILLAIAIGQTVHHFGMSRLIDGRGATGAAPATLGPV